MTEKEGIRWWVTKCIQWCSDTEIRGWWIFQVTMYIWKAIWGFFLSTVHVCVGEYTVLCAPWHRWMQIHMNKKMSCVFVDFQFTNGNRVSPSKHGAHWFTLMLAFNDFCLHLLTQGLHTCPKFPTFYTCTQIPNWGPHSFFPLGF